GSVRRRLTWNEPASRQRATFRAGRKFHQGEFRASPGNEPTAVAAELVVTPHEANQLPPVPRIPEPAPPAVPRCTDQRVTRRRKLNSFDSGLMPLQDRTRCPGRGVAQVHATVAATHRQQTPIRVPGNATDDSRCRPLVQ